MTAADKQIVTMYDELDVQPEDIVAELGGEFDIEAVKMCLLSHSLKYKHTAKQAVLVSNGNAADAQGIFTEEERQIARGVVVRLAQFAEQEAVQIRSAEVILTEQRAERTSQKLTALAGAKTNILQFQAHLDVAREKMRLQKEALKAQAGMIDITEQPRQKQLA